MTSILRGLHIERVDRVADPANADARITLFKARGGGSDQLICMLPEGCTFRGRTFNQGDRMPAGATRMQAGVQKTDQPAGMAKGATMPVDKDTLDPEVKALIETLEAQIAATPEPAAVIADADEAVLVEAAKSRGLVITKAAADDPLADVPANVRKALEDSERVAKEAQAEVAALRKADRTRVFVEKAKTLPGLGDPTELGGVIHKAADAMGDDSDEFKAFMRTLTATNAAKTEADAVLTKERGHTFQSTADAGGKIAELAKARQASEPGLSDAQARARVLSEHPDLYAEYAADNK